LLAAAQEPTQDIAVAQVTRLFQAGRMTEALNLANAMIPATARAAISRSREAQSQRNFAKAETEYQRAIAIVEAKFGRDHLILTSMLSVQADLCQQAHKANEAEIALKRALSISEQQLGRRTTLTADLLTNLADFYRASGQYEKSLPYYDRALTINIDIRGADNPSTATVLNNASLAYADRGEYDQAEKLASQALAIRQTRLDPAHTDIANSLTNLGLVYLDQGNYAKAEGLYQQALEILEKDTRANASYIVVVWKNLGALYHEKGDYAQAQSFVERVLRYREQTLGPKDPDTGKALADLCEIYQSRDEIDKAKGCFERALQIVKAALGLRHPETATALSNLGQFYAFQAQYVQAEALLREALSIKEKELGPDQPGTASTLTNLADVLVLEGEYAEGEKLLRRSIAIQERKLSPDHLHTAETLIKLAELYLDKEDFKQAEPLFQRALAIREKSTGPNSAPTSFALNGLAEFYRAKRDYDRALPLYLRSLQIRTKVFGEYHTATATCLNNLGLFFRETGRYEEGEDFLRRAFDVTERVYGASHPLTATSLVNLSAARAGRGDYAKAESLVRRAIAIEERVLPRGHPDTANSMAFLASLQERRGDLVGARNTLEDAISIQRASLGATSPSVARMLSILATVDWRLSKLREAVAELGEAEDIEDRSLANNLFAGSDRQRQAYMGMFTETMSQAVSLHLLALPYNSEAGRLAAEASLRYKGRVLGSMIEELRALRQRADPPSLKLLDALSDTRRRLGTIALWDVERRYSAAALQEVGQLQEREERLQSDISSQASVLRAIAQPVTVARVQRSLPKASALVDFVLYQQFDPVNGTPRWGNARYAAYVLSPSGEPHWVDLGEAVPIDTLCEQLRRALSAPDNTHIVNRIARELDEKTLRPVRPLLGETREVFVSPDGDLNLIPFAALIDERGRYLIEDYHFTYLSSGSDFLRWESDDRPRHNAMILANPNFDAPTPNHQSQTESTRSPRFLPLPGTAAEAQDLRKLLPSADIYVGTRASETVLKHAAGPWILHIATHGFFLADTPPPENLSAAGAISDSGQGYPLMLHTDSMLRSGLALAGANTGGDETEDGILTALEATNLDLHGTQLVVLSGCSTGVGDVRIGDGVQGLRRAFMVAGSRTQVISLWNVTDASTREMMVAYYKRILGGERRSAALRAVQLDMHTRGAAPYAWASFIASGEDVPLQK